MDGERGGTIPQKERPLLTELPHGATGCTAAEDLSQSPGRTGEEEELETQTPGVRVMQPQCRVAQVCCCALVTWAVSKLKQEDCHKFQASLGYRAEILSHGTDPSTWEAEDSESKVSIACTDPASKQNKRNKTQTTEL